MYFFNELKFHALYKNDGHALNPKKRLKKYQCNSNRDERKYCVIFIDLIDLYYSYRIIFSWGYSIVLYYVY